MIDGNGWKITVGHAQHVQPYLECLAFRIDTKEGSICYTGDSGPSDSIVELAKGCDVLIHMNHYFSGTEPTPAYRAACGNHRDNARDREARRREDAGADAPARRRSISPASASRSFTRSSRSSTARSIWGEDLMRLTFAAAGVSAIETRQG